MRPEPECNQVTQTRWYADGLRFECTQCGNCCGGAPGYVWVSREEIRKIARYMDLTAEEFARRYVRRVGFKFSLIEKPNLDCIFLHHADGKGTCSIYPVRPLQCRTWPFWNVNLKTAGAWAAAGEGCPGINHGPLHNLITIERIRTAMTWSDVP